MKWLFICDWLISILFFFFRGKIKPTRGKTFIDQSVILAPLNTLLNLCSKEKFRSGSFVPKNTLLAVPNNRELASVSR